MLIMLIVLLLSYGITCFLVLGEHHRHVTIDPFVWWLSLSLVTACFFVRAFLSSSSTVHHAHMRRCALVVCFCYLHRAVFMHCTVERDCFWDLALCCSLWGRTVACTGELTFVYMSVKQLAPSQTKLIMVLISCAQTISFIGVMKKHYLWFFFENSIWTFCAIFLALHVYLYNTRTWFKSVPWLLLAFTCYNLYEDLPMYLQRNKDKTHLPGYNLGIIEGAWDALSCDLVSQSNHVWDPQMLWQTLNYTIVPAAAVSLMVCSDYTDSDRDREGVHSRKDK